jgi:hypothetical protein
MGALITVLAPIVGDLVKRLIPDGDKSMDVEKESLESLRGKIVLEEAKSGHWLTATWRPLLMMVIIAIVALNYLIFPVMGLFMPETYAIDLPQELWNLLQIGVGGYIVGRSGEKMIDTWKKD